jgi:hypothetical protein
VRPVVDATSFAVRAQFVELDGVRDYLLVFLVDVAIRIVFSALMGRRFQI